MAKEKNDETLPRLIELKEVRIDNCPKNCTIGEFIQFFTNLQHLYGRESTAEFAIDFDHYYAALDGIVITPKRYEFSAEVADRLIKAKEAKLRRAKRQKERKDLEKKLELTRMVKEIEQLQALYEKYPDALKV